MIKKIICFLFGHKIVIKAFTGKTMEQTNMVGNPITVSLYVWRKMDFCIRCGKRNNVN